MPEQEFNDDLRQLEEAAELDATISRSFSDVSSANRTEEKYSELAKLAKEIKARDDSKARTGWGKFLRQIRQMDFATRRIVTSAALGLWTGLADALATKFGDQYGVSQMLSIVLVVVAFVNCAMTKKRELGAVTGAAFGFAMIAGTAVFNLMFQSGAKISGTEVIPYTLISGLVGLIIGGLGDRIMRIRFQHDPQKRREYLLKQLIELQEELRRGESNITFMSVDVVGSTDMKRGSDMLEVEYTFNEYTHYVVSTGKGLGGALHSTAGDGILMTFNSPQNAFMAARRIIAGMMEFNKFKNRLGYPFQVRCGIHTGRVMAPSGDAGNVNYSHVIDVTAHTQKVAPVNGIALSEEAAEQVESGISPTQVERTEVKGSVAYLWRAVASPIPDDRAETGPPPLPPRARA